MKTQTLNTDQATARPWKVMAGTIIQSCDDRMHIADTDFYHDDEHFEEVRANAALIVAAVNQFEAHQAIALAARNLLDAVSAATPDAMTCLEGRLADALAQLDNAKG